MPKHSAASLPSLTPRPHQVVNWVINSVALGTHDDDAEIGVIADRLKTTPGRLATILRRLEEQGYVTVKGDFVYPTAAALRQQDPDLSESKAARLLRGLR